MLTIGGFSDKGNISKRMLRHYDSIGLLAPSYTGENGYRYYDETQIADLMQIKKLSSYGFSLSEIKEILPLSEMDLANRIHHKRLENYGRLNKLKEQLRNMEEDVAEMKGADYIMEKYHVIIMEQPQQTVFTLRRTINISETGQLFEDLIEGMEKAGLKRTGPCQQIFMGTEFNYESMDIEAQVQVAEGNNNENIKTLPAGTYAATTHIGPYENVRYAFEAMGEWYKNQDEYEIIGPSIERYIKDVDDVDSPEDLETAVLFPIKKK